MACKACGGTVMDAQGACASCGMPSDASADTQPNGAAAVPVAVLVRTESPATPAAPQSDPSDPAATNPGSGVFCGRCGSAVDPLSDFCGICGSPMRESAAARLRQERLHGAGKVNPLTEADAADTLPPLGAPHAVANPARLLGMLVVGIVLISIALGVLIWHLR